MAGNYYLSECLGWWFTLTGKGYRPPLTYDSPPRGRFPRYQPYLMKNLCTLFAVVFCLFLSYPAHLSAQGSPPISLQIVPDVDTLFVCTGEQVQLNALGATTFRWTPAEIFDDPTIPNPTVVNLTQDTWVVVESMVNGTIEFDSILLSVVDPAIQLSASTNDPICRGETVTLTATNNVNDQGLSWTPTETILSDPTEGTITVQPDQTTTYTATLEVQGCTEVASISVDVRPDRVDITNPDTVFLCKGDEVTLEAITSSPTNEDFRWYSSFGPIPITDKSFTISPERNATIYAEIVTDDCTITDSTYIQIDSLPPSLGLTADPEKEVYCEGDLVTLTSITYEPSDYPDIMHQWFSVPPDGGFETPDTLFNMVFTAQDSAIFKRTTTNNGCVDSVILVVPVTKPPMITIEPENPILCPGESVQLQVNLEGPGSEDAEIEWMPTEGLSCTDCLDPVATPQALTATYSVTATVEECPASQSITLQVLPPPVTLNPDLTICAGESISLVVTANTNAGATFEWREAGSNTILSTDPFFEPTPAADITYVLTAQYPDCDPVTFDVPVRVVQEPTLTVGPGATVCPDEPVMLTASSNAPDDVSEFYQWNVDVRDFEGPDVEVVAGQSTTAILTYIYGDNCAALTESVEIEVLDVPSIEEITVNPESATTDGLPLGESVGLRVTTDPEEPANVTYSWTANGESIGGNSPDIEHTPSDDPTVYEVTITTEDGCTVTREISINVVAPRFDIPNAFSPNDDNVNDFFNVVFVGGIDIVEFKVWNRWGELVYDNDTPETGWDGNINGDPAPSDVYVYKILIRFPDGQEFTEQGEITLIR